MFKGLSNSVHIVYVLVEMLMWHSQTDVCTNDELQQLTDAVEDARLDVLRKWNTPEYKPDQRWLIQRSLDQSKSLRHLSPEAVALRDLVKTLRETGQLVPAYVSDMVLITALHKGAGLGDIRTAIIGYVFPPVLREVRQSLPNRILTWSFRPDPYDKENPVYGLTGRTIPAHEVTYLNRTGTQP